jgi:uncharacterized protein (TIGR03382 family)
MKDGEFDRLRIPLDSGSNVPGPNGQGVDAQRTGDAASPIQLAAGSAILAGLILLGVAALRRRRGSGPHGAGGPS